MQDTAGTWLMTALTHSPLLIALMQTAASLPVLLLGLLAGATADVFDRRRLLIFWQVWMLAAVAVLAVLTFLGHISPWALLAFTFLLNAGSAMNNPAWQAIVPELIDRSLIPDAVSLNSASNNLARAVGPALGGLMVASFQQTDTGAGSVFLLNALSFAGVIWVLVNWKRVPLFRSTLPTERIAGSMRSGLRYVRYAPEIQASLLRAFTFTFFVSAVWSLLAVVAQRDLHQGALGYGILNGALGAGAVVAATTLHRLRARFKADTIIAAATAVYVATMVLMATVKLPALLIGTLVIAGFAWTSTMATLNTSVQLSVPAWVQARVLGTYLMTFQGGLALGSMLWGAVAERTNASTALLASATGMAISYPFARRFHILRGAAPDLSPYQWKRAAPQFVLDSADTEPTAGPVRISITYRVPVERYAEFTRAIHRMRGVRLRDGAIRWGIFRDAGDPESLNETFVMESWIDYLRARERVTAADAVIREAVRALADRDPVTTHQVYAKEVTAPQERARTAPDKRVKTS